MNEFDAAIRKAVRHSLSDNGVPIPIPPQFIREPVLARRRAPVRLLLYMAAALSVGFLSMTFVGRSAFAELENTVSAVVRFFEVDINGQLHPLESQSLTLNEALQTQTFGVVAPAGLPANAELRSIQRVGSASSTMVIFNYQYGVRTFSIIETPASGTPGNVFYSARPPAGPNGTSLANPGKNFTVQATVWTSGSAKVALFTKDALTSSEIAGIERAMQRPSGIERAMQRP